MVIDWSKFLNFILHWIIINRCGSRTEDSNDGVDLSPEGVSNELVRVGFPDRKDASDGKVGINNWTSIKWIEGNHISLSFSDDFIDRSFFTGKGFDLWVFFQMFLNHFITMNILMELCISKKVLSFQYYNGGVP